MPGEDSRHPSQSPRWSPRRALSLFVLLTLGAPLTARGPAADLRPAPRTAVELRLTGLLLPGTERHRTPRSGSLDSFFRAMPAGRSPAIHGHSSGACGRIEESQFTRSSRGHARPLGDRTAGTRAPPSEPDQSIASRSQTRLAHWMLKATAMAVPMRAPERNEPPRSRASGTNRPQAIGKARTTGQRDENGR
jgi:hypothetical protein